MGAELLDKLKAEDLPNDDVLFLVDVIGLENVLKLLKLCRGMSFYVPARLPKAFCRKYVLNHYNPATPNTKALSGALGITERQIYRILKSQRPARRAA